MRSIFYSLLSLATIATTLATDAAKPTSENADDDWEEKVPDTIFNGQTVPPMKELGVADLEDAITKGNW